MEKERKNYFNIFFASPFVFMLVEVIQMAPMAVLGKTSGNTIPYFTLDSAVNSVTSCVLAGFYINAVRKGYGDLNDATILFKKEVFSKFIPLMLVKLVMETAVNLAITATAEMGVINSVVAIISSLILMLYIPIWYLLVLNPNKDTKTYFKYAENIIIENLGKYLGVTAISVIAIIVAIVVVLPIVLVLNILGLILYIPFLLTGGSILMMIIANFMNEVIPSEWENNLTENL